MTEKTKSVFTWIMLGLERRKVGLKLGSRLDLLRSCLERGLFLCPLVCMGAFRGVWRRLFGGMIERRRVAKYTEIKRFTGVCRGVAGA